MARATKGGQTSLRIVLEVAHNLLDEGCCLYLDNCYTSQNLVDILCTRKTDVGTLRTERKEFPEFVKRARLKRGNSGSILQETDDLEVERQKGCRDQHIL
jgi:hypothetical protein